FNTSHYGRLLIRSIRPVTETYNIAIQIYTLSEGYLLSQSIQSGRDALYSYSTFNTSHYGRLLLQYSPSSIHALLRVAYYFAQFDLAETCHTAISRSIFLTGCY
ncbi:hypothetical protein GIB67_014694, partial [Kingdonia uniflora]